MTLAKPAAALRNRNTQTHAVVGGLSNGISSSMPTAFLGETWGGAVQVQGCGKAEVLLHDLVADDWRAQ